jgi:hypothetical protein
MKSIRKWYQLSLPNRSAVHVPFSGRSAGYSLYWRPGVEVEHPLWLGMRGVVILRPAKYYHMKWGDGEEELARSSSLLEKPKCHYMRAVRDEMTSHGLVMRSHHQRSRRLIVVARWKAHRLTRQLTRAHSSQPPSDACINALPTAVKAKDNSILSLKLLSAMLSIANLKLANIIVSYINILPLFQSLRFIFILKCQTK